MHEHDRDLIAALAEERLTGPRAEAARAELAACAECRAELAAHQRALEFLRSAEPPRLTELEAARMREGVLREAGVDRARPSSRLGSIPWAATLTAAAAIAGLVMLGPVLGILGGGGSPAEAPEAAGLTEADPGADTMAADEPAADIAPQAEARATDPSLLEPRHLGDLGEIGEPELRALLEDPVFEEAALLARRHVPELRARVADSSLAGLACFHEGYALSDRNLVALVGASVVFEGREAAALAYAGASTEGPEAPLDEQVLWVLDAGDCRILHSQGSAPGG